LFKRVLSATIVKIEMNNLIEKSRYTYLPTIKMILFFILLTNGLVITKAHFFHETWHGFIKTHGSVLCGPRKQGVRKLSEYIDRNNKVAIFVHP